MIDPMVVDVNVSESEIVFDLGVDQLEAVNVQVDALANYDVTVSETELVFDLTVDGGETFDADLDVAIQIAPSVVYTGEYVVDPSASDDIILPTTGYVMADDVTVKKIRTAETRNPSGITFYIASEV